MPLASHSAHTVFEAAKSKSHLLCIVPPYRVSFPPASSSALLGYLKARGCNDFGFLDLRLFTQGAQERPHTWQPLGVFGDCYVVDIPDLPLVLRVLGNYDAGRESMLDGVFDDEFEAYCLDRGLIAEDVADRFLEVERVVVRAFEGLKELRFVGFSVWTSNLITTLLAAGHLKRRKNPPFIVAGGPQVTQSRASVQLGLRSGLFDVVVKGDGEEPLAELVDEFSRKGSVERTIAGTVRLRSSDGSLESVSRPPPMLATLPVPSFDEMYLPAYPRTPRGLQILPYQLSRGCTDKCTFCSEWGLWERFRLAPVELAADQVEELVRRYGAQAFRFTDSLINGQMARMREFAELLVRRNTQIKWFGYMRAQMDDETARLLARSGFVRAFIGVESLDDETLGLMNKRRTEVQNLQALRAFLRAGINCSVGYVPAFPGSTREKFLRTGFTLRALQREFPGMVETNADPFMLMPGSPMYEAPEKYGLEVTPWPDEVIGRAGKYADIAKQVPCKVLTSTPAIEMVGQRAIAATLNRSVLSVGRTVRNDIAFQHIHGDIHLAKTINSDGQAYSLLVTEEEKQQLQALKGKTYFSGRFGLPVLEEPGCAALIRSIASSHLIPPERKLTVSLVPMLSLDRPSPETPIMMSPIVLARQLGDECLFCVGDGDTGLSRLPAPVGRALCELAQSVGPCAFRDYEEKTRPLGVSVNWRALLKSGVLVALEGESPPCADAWQGSAQPSDAAESGASAGARRG